MNRQFQILNRQEVEKTWGVTAKGRTAEFLIYDEVSPWGITAKDVVTELNALDDGIEKITVRINSPGGDVFDGFAIYNAFRNHPADVTTIVDGNAASIASIIAMASDKPAMHKSSSMMIHDPWSFAVGTARDLRRQADVLDKHGDLLVDIYADRSGMPADDVVALMKAETWLKPDEALEAGLIANVIEGPAPTNLARFDLSAFGRQPETPVPEPVDTKNLVRSMTLRLQEVSL